MLNCQLMTLSKEEVQLFQERCLHSLSWLQYDPQDPNYIPSEFDRVYVINELTTRFLLRKASEE